jgi:ABC-type hemin transport system substrate-binding protein
MPAPRIVVSSTVARPTAPPAHPLSMPAPRIVSLIASATGIVDALGQSDRLQPQASRRSLAGDGPAGRVMMGN